MSSVRLAGRETRPTHMHADTADDSSPASADMNCCFSPSAHVSLHTYIRIYIHSYMAHASGGLDAARCSASTRRFSPPRHPSASLSPSLRHPFSSAVQRIRRPRPGAACHFTLPDRYLPCRKADALAVHRAADRPTMSAAKGTRRKPILRLHRRTALLALRHRFSL